MAINPHHTIEELNGIRCSIVEKKISTDRAQFIKKILECNGLEVQLQNDEAGFTTIGVPKVVFNLIHALYARALKTPEGKLLTPAYWYQKEQTDQFYWNYK